MQPHKTWNVRLRRYYLPEAIDLCQATGNVLEWLGSIGPAENGGDSAWKLAPVLV